MAAQYVCPLIQVVPPPLHRKSPERKEDAGMMTKAAVLLLVFTLMGCAAKRGPWWDQELIDARTETLNAYVGRHKSIAIQHFGPVEQRDPDGLEGEILTWVLSKAAPGASLSRNTFSRDYSLSTTGGAISQVRLFVDAEGIIYMWHYADPSGSYSPTHAPEHAKH